MTDNELGSLFSDLHKDVYNVRPHSNWSRDDMIKFCEQWTTPQAQAELLTLWADEDAAFEHLLMKWQMEQKTQQELNDINQPNRFELLAEQKGW